jgi:hypothetical protein
MAQEIKAVTIGWTEDDGIVVAISGEIVSISFETARILGRLLLRLANENDPDGTPLSPSDVA